MAAPLSLSHSSSAPQSFYFDEKWKLSKKEGYPSRSSPLRKSSSSNSSNNNNNKRITTNSHHKRCGFTRKCARLVKEQRARFYIMRRCVTMLICWRDYGDP